MNASRSANTRRPLCWRLAYPLTLAFVTGMLALPAAAEAAGRTPAGAGSATPARTAIQAKVSPDICDFPHGITGTVAVQPPPPHPYGGTIFTFPSGTTCGDLRLDYVSVSQRYYAWYDDPAKDRWVECAEHPYVKAGYPRSHPAVCEDIVPGTQLMVVAGTKANIIVED
jgi:hypothetical protein